MNENMDRDMRQLVQHPVELNQKFESDQSTEGNITSNITWYCQKYHCYAQDPLTQKVDPFESVDLREEGLMTPARSQLSCGACWAFSTACLLETMILRTKGQKDVPTFWNQFTNTTINISEDYIATNNFGFSNFCSGGDVGSAM